LENTSKYALAPQEGYSGTASRLYSQRSKKLMTTAVFLSELPKTNWSSTINKHLQKMITSEEAEMTAL